MALWSDGSIHEAPCVPTRITASRLAGGPFSIASASANSSCSPSPPAPSPLLSPLMSEQSIDQCLDRACAIRRQIKQLQAELETIDDRLTAAHEAGELDSSFTHNDWCIIHSPGRARWTYAPRVTAMQSALKQAQEQSQADGTAARTIGAPFWTFKEPRQ
jgi:hypothetical protein